MFQDDDNNDSGDIDALNSILNWEEDDETAVASSVEATTNVLAQREQPQHFFPQPDPIPTANPMFNNPFPQQQWSIPGMPPYFSLNAAANGQQQSMTMTTTSSSQSLMGPMSTPPPPPVAPPVPSPVPATLKSGKTTNGNSTQAAPTSAKSSASSSCASQGKKMNTSSSGKTSKSSKSAAFNSSIVSSDPDEPKNKANLTPEEKAKVNRDRNREHARNTRLRKKQYLENLKKSLSELGKERDLMVHERAAAANMMAEMTKTRTETLMNFFALRSMYERRRDMWSNVLDESGFRCLLPVTPYRSFPSSEVQVDNIQRTILGIDNMIADTASLHVMMNNLVNRNVCPDGVVRFSYTLVTEDSVVAGNQIMARWVMSTVNAVQCGARAEVTKKGMLCCKFNSLHRIVSLELMFDVMAFMLQLKQSCGNDSFCVVPNTVRTCQRVFSEPMVITLAEYPYTIVQVNQNWEDMTEYKAEDVVGKHSCSILQGATTERTKIVELTDSMLFKRPAMIHYTNYTKNGRRFKNFLSAYPLSSDSKITHYLGLTTHYKYIQDGPSTAVPRMNTSIGTTGYVPAISSDRVGPVVMAPPSMQQPQHGSTNGNSTGISNENCNAGLRRNSPGAMLPQTDQSRQKRKKMC